MRDALGTDRDSGVLDLFGYRLELTREEGWLRLSAVALAIISHHERAPYVRAMATYALAGVGMGHPWYEAAFNWALRTTSDAIEMPVLETARELMAQEAPTAQRAAWWLLSALCTSDALQLRHQISAEYGYKNFLRQRYEKDPCSGFFLWDRRTYARCLEESRLHPTSMAEQLREVVLDPSIDVPEKFSQGLDRAGEGMDMNNVRGARWRSAEDLVLEQIEPALCAWRPERLAGIWRALARKLPERAGLSRHLLAWEISEHLLVMEREDRLAIEHAWRTTLQSDSEEDDYAEHILFPCVLWGRPVKEQLDLIEERGDHNGYFSDYPPRIEKLQDSDLPTVAAQLEALVEDDHKRAYNLLWQLGHALTTFSGTIRTTLLRFFRQGNSATRGLCLRVFANMKDREMCRYLLAEKWTAQEVEEDYGRHWGSMLLCEEGADMPFAKIAEHVTLPLLGYAVQCRGSRQEEVTVYGDLIYKIWRGITLRQPERHPDVERTTIRTNRVEPTGEPGSWKISDDQDSLRFISWDSVWGGGTKEDSIDGIQQAFDPDARTLKVNEANQSLRRFAEAERRAGNPWFLHSFDRSALVDVVSSCPGYVEQWLQGVMETTPAAKTLLLRCRSFYEALCEVLLNQKPEQGVRLFWRLFADNTSRLSDTTTGIDSLLFGVLSARDSEPVNQLRRHLFDKSTTDNSLFELTFLAQFHGWYDGLQLIVDAWLASSHPFDRARGLTLLGFMDARAAADLLKEWTDTQHESWIRDRAEVATYAHQRNQWAKHWFRIFLVHEDDLRSWAAFRLFLRCVDRRFWLWGQEMVEREAVATHRIGHYQSNRGNIRKAAAENERDVLKLEKRLVGCDVIENQVWPWMSRYLERDLQ